jgi:nitroimidazol reductase NimA-like FMN-containing flavoprotein (pyridoxamine 5'-phosphate oxidase superfamily)
MTTNPGADDMGQEKLQHHIHQLLESQKLAVLSTTDKGRPYASLLAFAYSADLRHIYFATTRATRKYANLMGQPRAAFLIDNRANCAEDFHQAAAVTVTGNCREITEKDKGSATANFLDTHPYLEDFIKAPTTAFFVFDVEKYIHVSRFQEVFEYRVADATDT